MVNKTLTNNSSMFCNRRKTIGVLVGSQSSHFQEGIVRGANAMAKELDFNIITFAGGPMNPPKSSPQRRDRLFEHLNMNLFDGFIIPLSSLTRFISEEEREKFLNRFGTIPIVNVSGYYEDLINITSDYSSGLSSLISHYVNVHKYKRIAFFRGPINHGTSNERHEIYKKELEANGLIYDEDLVVYGDLDASKSNDFISELFDKRKKICDAIITMNDSTAIEVMTILKSRGINVPKDIAVSGSMNINDGKFSKPKLTTIQEPIDQLAKKAVLVLKDIFEGKEVSNKYIIPTTLVVRESCGCIEKKNDINHLTLLMENKFSKESLAEYCNKEMQGIFLKSEYGNIWDVLNDYKRALNSNNPENFLSQLENCIKASLSETNISIWTEFVKKMQDETLKHCVEKESAKNGFQILHMLNQLLEFLHGKELAYQIQETKFYMSYLRSVSQNLNPSFNLVAIHKYVSKLMSLKNCFIVIYKNDKNSTNNVECLQALSHEKFIDLSSDQKNYEEQAMVPTCIQPFLERYEFIIFPLYYKAEPLGYLFLDYNVQNCRAYENIQVLISASLKNEIQQADLKIAKDRFRDIAYSTSDWLWETNEEGIFTYCSTSVFSVLGYTNNQIIGRHIEEVLDLNQSDVDLKIRKKHTLLNLKCSAKHKNGDLRYLLISGIPHDTCNKFICYRGVLKDITNQTLQEERIKHLAYYDILTSLPNRTLFQEKLDQLIKDSQLTKARFAIIFFDIDRFKYINDSMGHNAGDIILQKVAHILKQSIKSTHILARIGGDEFTIIIPNVISREEVINTSEIIIKNLKPEFKLKGQSLYVTMSFGISMYPVDGNNAITLLKNADNAMYKAKSCGRNQYIFYDQIIKNNNMTRIQKEELLHNAIKNDQFFLEYQPQVITSTGKINGFEALVRMKHPTLKTIYPNDFIPLAEELGLIGEIDEWVLNEVCKCISTWEKKGYQLCQYL